MRNYLEISLLPNPEINVNFIWSKVFQQIHLGLVAVQDDQGRVPIGVSFPDYATAGKICTLGSKLRLFAHEEATLANFNVSSCLFNLKDYVQWTSIRPVPERIMGYGNYKREQPKTNIERLARRYAKRHNVSFASAMQAYSKMKNQILPAPFIRLKSLSSKNSFCLWVKKSVTTDPLNGTFSSYGLSSISTVPEF